MWFWLLESNQIDMITPLPWNRLSSLNWYNIDYVTATPWQLRQRSES
jgi:hypothetical protein